MQIDWTNRGAAVAGALAAGHMMEGEARELRSKGSCASDCKRANICEYEEPCTSDPVAKSDPCKQQRREVSVRCEE